MEKREQLNLLNGKEKISCKDCSIKNRCNHSCGCINKLSTGFIDQLSVLQCENERMLFPIADKLAEKLYKKRSALFIHKQYNEMYPVLSIIEDRIKKI